jgi:hypothetical protein
MNTYTSKKIITIAIVACYSIPSLAQKDPFDSKDFNEFQKNIKAMLDDKKIELKNQSNTLKINDSNSNQSEQMKDHRKGSAFATNNDTENELQQMMQVIGVPKNETYLANDWGQLNKIYPKINWKSIQDKEYSFAKGGSTVSRKTRFDITAKGARTVMMEIESSTFGYGDGYAFRNQLKALGPQVKTVCTDKENGASTGFAWYEISSKEYNPIYVYISWSAGSGGVSETINLTLKPIPNSCTTKNYWEKQSIALTTKSIVIGYLKNSIMSGAGCTYYFASDFKKKNKMPIGTDMVDSSGMVLNINGRDVLVKGSNNSKGEFLGSFDTTTLRIPAGKSKDCGEECAMVQTNFNLNSSGIMTQTPVIGICGS